jgi:hypothetical protein
MEQVTHRLEELISHLATQEAPACGEDDQMLELALQVHDAFLAPFGEIVLRGEWQKRSKELRSRALCTHIQAENH